MAVIELGLVHPEGDEPPAGPGRRPPRPDRRLLVAVLAACTLLTVTGSARPAPRGLTPLWSVPYAQESDSFRLAGDSVYVLGHTGSRRLTARDARTGAERWSTADIDPTTWLTTVQAGVMLLPAGLRTFSHEEPDGTVSTRDFHRDTVAIDTATGKPLWRQRGEVTSTFGDHALVSEWNETGERAETLRVVRVRDGGTVWSRPSGGIDFWMTETMTSAPPERLITVTARGVIEVLALADGSLLTTGRLPWINSPREDEYSSITVHDRRLYLDQTVRSTSSISVYDLGTLRRLWHAERPAPGGSYPCGPVVCLNDGQGTAGHDLATGELRWRLPESSNGVPLGDGRLLLEENGAGRRSLVDAATGRMLANLGTSMPVSDALGLATPYLIAQTIEPPGRTSVSSFHPSTGELLLRGSITPVLDYGCQHENGLLACATQDSRLAVTAVS